MFDTVVLDGELELINICDAELILEIAEDGEYGAFTALRDGYPAYDGDTTVTPSQDTQTLYTAQKSVLENITINPIPSNYGLITWNGYTLTVS